MKLEINYKSKTEKQTRDGGQYVIKQQMDQRWQNPSQYCKVIILQLK